MSIIKVKVSCHLHELSSIKTNEIKFWPCNSLTTLDKKCERALSEDPYKAYSCTKNCFFILCDKCAFKYKIEEK